MLRGKTSLKDRKTFVFVDVSNIRNACERSLGFWLDFDSFYQYLDSKFDNLQEVRYYEGIAAGDRKKRGYFRHLKKVGYTICSLERKSYTNEAKYADFECSECGVLNTVQVLPESPKLKSNVDVYMAVDMMKCAIRATDPIHVILVSCDGDFAEAIHGILSVNPDVFITVLATPMTSTNNCLSVRLKNLRKDLPNDMALMNIDNIRGRVAKSITKGK